MQLLADRYELTAPLGRGGMGQVWEGIDRQLERRVAIKLLTNESLASRSDPTQLVRRFAQEASVTAGLQHPGVPAVHDAGAYEDGLFLVMELVEGCTVGDLIAEHGPLPVPWVAAIAAQVCAVLAVAHERSLVHRDIKPQNLMLTSDGTVKVLDFGVSTILDAAGVVRITKTGETVGTLAYMAPEQLRSDTTTPRTDLYALGCVMYEMLAGEPVFEATTPHALGYKHLEETPAPLRRSDAPPELNSLVRQLLAKEPGQRPAGARDVYERLLGLVVPSLPLGDVNPLGTAPGGMHLYSRVLVRLTETAQAAAAPRPSAPPTGVDSVRVSGSTRVPFPTSVAPGPASHPPHAHVLGAQFEPPVPRRSVGWKLLHSLWIAPTFAFGFLTWGSFLYIGLRHRDRNWLISALVHTVLLVGGVVFMVVTTDEHGIASTHAAVYWLMLAIGGPAHALTVNVRRLRLRAYLDLDRPGVAPWPRELSHGPYPTAAEGAMSTIPPPIPSPRSHVFEVRTRDRGPAA